MNRTIVVVPCYNEAQRLDVRRFEQFVGNVDGIEFLFVNDGSRDATLERLEGLHARNPRRFSFLHLACNGGKAEAVRQGCLLALESEPDYLGYWDADLATPLTDIPTFADVLESKPQIELVVGCRLPLLGRKIERQPLRRALGRVFAKTASFLLGLSIYDTQCGAKLFRVTPTFRQVMAAPFLTSWIFDVEILARMRVVDRQHQMPLAETIYEQPLDHWRDVAGSKLRRGDFARAIGEMARIYTRYLRPGAEWTPPAAPPYHIQKPRRAA